MYEIIHTKAIIFLERREKEYDKVFFIFSEVLGLTSVTAPGILKPMAKLNSLLQPFRIVTADVVVGKSTKKITTVIDHHSFEKLLTHHETKRSLLRVFEFITVMVPRNIPIPEIYTLFESYIRTLEGVSDIQKIRQLETSTLYTILKILGYVSTEDIHFSTSQETFLAEHQPHMHKELLHRVNALLKEIQT